jgi:hypothetical protein
MKIMAYGGPRARHVAARRELRPPNLNRHGEPAEKKHGCDSSFDPRLDLRSMCRGEAIAKPNLWRTFNSTCIQHIVRHGPQAGSESGKNVELV